MTKPCRSSHTGCLWWKPDNSLNVRKCLPILAPLRAPPAPHKPGPWTCPPGRGVLSMGSVSSLSPLIFALLSEIKDGK
jgi:hypothetical protein